MKTINRKEELRQELDRRSGLKQSMLRRFQEQGEIDTGEMLRYFGSGHSTRRTELKKAGHRIVTVYEKPGLYRYVYFGKWDDQDDAKVNEAD